MEIQEVPIAPPRKRKIRASRKVLASTEQYLNDNGLSFNQLTPAQQISVVGYIKMKRACLSLFLVALVCFIFVSVVCYRFYKNTATEFANSLMPDEYVVEAEDGSKVLKTVEESLKEEIRMYGTICSVLASVLVVGLYTSVYGLVKSIETFSFVRQGRKVLEAFLPSVRTAVQSETSGNAHDTEVQY